MVSIAKEVKSVKGTMVALKKRQFGILHIIIYIYIYIEWHSLIITFFAHTVDGILLCLFRIDFVRREIEKSR